MFKLYLKIGARYLLKNKLYSFINVFGLAIGVMSFIMIMCYVSMEWSYDKFEESHLVHRVFMDYIEGDQFVPGDANSYQLSGATLTEKFPEIESYVRFRRFDEQNFVVDRQVYDNQIISMVDPSYFDIFNQKLVLGNESTALVEPFSIVISEILANTIFGQENPIGRKVELALDGQFLPLTVTGVIDFSNRKTHIPTDCLVSLSSYFNLSYFERERQNVWTQNEFYTYLKVRKGTNFADLNSKVMAFKPGEGIHEFERHHLEPLESIHLNSNKPYEAQVNGSASSVRMLALIALITMLLSWINYANLTTSKSMERAKEIGVRKVVGAGRYQLVGQFLLESFVLNTAAILLGVILTILVLPTFSSFVGYDFSIDSKMLRQLLPYLLIVLFGTSLVSFLPSFAISKYKPTSVLKGKLANSSSGLFIRRALLIGQFVATICLLSGTFIAYKQINYIKNRPLGTNLNQVLAIKGQAIDRSRDSLFYRDFSVVLEELRKKSYVADITVASTYPGEDHRNANSNVGIQLMDGTTDVKHIWYNYAVWPNYFDLMEMDFLAGESFHQTDQKKSKNIVVNETMATLMGAQDPQDLIGKTTQFWGEDWQIVGVLKDYSHFGIKSLAKPMIIRHNHTSQNILIKLNEQVISLAGMDDALHDIESVWRSVFPMSTLDYHFVDSQFESTYADEQRLAKVFPIFTLLSILIASLGLFGLTSYTLINRTKEIGIRKVNGASIAQILQLLNQNFVKWVGLAFVIAVPVSWFGMDRWLQGFAYKTTLSWWVFALAGLTTLLISLLTVSWQSFKAATANPIKSLRDE
ncbi:MAG: ABC transporter permease [Allomuricauda sp.]